MTGDNYDYEVDIRRYFVESDEVNSRGKPVMRPVVIRRLFLTATEPSTLFPDLKVFRYKREGEWRYSVSRLVVHPAPQYFFEKPKPPKWKRQESFTECAFLKWLSGWIGSFNAVIALHRLITEDPKTD